MLKLCHYPVSIQRALTPTLYSGVVVLLLLRAALKPSERSDARVAVAGVNRQPRLYSRVVSETPVSHMRADGEAPAGVVFGETSKLKRRVTGEAGNQR